MRKIDQIINSIEFPVEILNLSIKSLTDAVEK